jgi:hypothetical protein
MLSGPCQPNLNHAFSQGVGAERPGQPLLEGARTMMGCANRIPGVGAAMEWARMGAWMVAAERLAVIPGRGTSSAYAAMVGLMDRRTKGQPGRFAR